MTCPSATGVELVILGRSYPVSPDMVGLTAEFVEMLDDLEPEEQRRLVEAVLYGRVEMVGPVLTFHALDDSKIRYTVTTDATGRSVTEIGDLT